MNIKELKEYLKHYDDNLSCAWALWLPGDVRAIAKEENAELSDEEIGEILDDIHSHQSAEFGINWESLRCAVQDFARDREEEGD